MTPSPGASRGPCPAEQYLGWCRVSEKIIEIRPFKQLAPSVRGDSRPAYAGNVSQVEWRGTRKDPPVGRKTVYGCKIYFPVGPTKVGLASHLRRPEGQNSLGGGPGYLKYLHTDTILPYPLLQRAEQGRRGREIIRLIPSTCKFTTTRECSTG